MKSRQMRAMRLWATCLFLTSGLSTTAQQVSDISASDYKAELQAVDEYCPAPGQYINTMPPYEEGDDAATMAQKCTRYLASDDSDERGVVCLGAYGGYLTFHFDHPVANVEGERDFAVFGNSFRSQMFPDVVGGSAEPGIVMVSQDLNQNGLPDDPWWELSGSADTDSAASVSSSLPYERRLIYGYEVTYARPNALEAVPWTDNQGHTGQVARVDEYHAQEYWPLWMHQSSLTFGGTRLPRNLWFFQQGRYRKQWIYVFLDHGYVDNQVNTDTLGCSFDISWAVHPITRQPAPTLSSIDFVRVYTAMNQTQEQLGETSTEVSGALDLHLPASIEAMKERSSLATSLRRTAAGVDDSSMQASTGQGQSQLLCQFGRVAIVRLPGGKVVKRLQRR